MTCVAPYIAQPAKCQTLAFVHDIEISTANPAMLSSKPLHNPKSRTDLIVQVQHAIEKAKQITAESRRTVAETKKTIQDLRETLGKIRRP